MRLRIIVALLLFSTVIPASAQPLVSLVWHDVATTPGRDKLAVTPRELKRQLEYVRRQGYTPVTLAQVIRAHRGQGRLPRKPILLCFDDGLKSYRDVALPLLRAYGYPSVLSVVTGWLDGKDVPKAYVGKLLSWRDLRTLVRSPLVEIASHTDDLHHEVRMNRQGNTDGASITREYLGLFHWRYETESEFRQRIRSDLALSRKRLWQELHDDTTVLTWPYGKYDDEAEAAARDAGFRVFLTLDQRPTTDRDWPRIGRVMVAGDLTLADLTARLRDPRAGLRAPYRFVEIHLDPFAGVWPPTQERLLGELLARLRALQVNTVIVSAFTRDGSKAFFPNRTMPVAADVLSRVLRQIHTRTRVRNLFVQVSDRSASAETDRMWRDFARLNHFNGVVFGAEFTPARRRAVEQIVHRYRARLRIGIAGEKPKSEKVDFRVLRIGITHPVEPGELRTLRRSHGPTVLASIVAGEGSNSIAARLDELRSAGVHNYGVTWTTQMGQAVAESLGSLLRVPVVTAVASEE
jgi:peptidoglycan/xylan/chitin deacetylase (PgdA/CDA1 family)